MDQDQAKKKLRLRHFMVEFLRKNGFFGKDIGVISSHMEDAMRYAVSNMMLGIESELYYGAKSEDGEEFVGVKSMLGERTFGDGNEK